MFIYSSYTPLPPRPGVPEDEDNFVRSKRCRWRRIQREQWQLSFPRFMLSNPHTHAKIWGSETTDKDMKKVMCYLVGSQLGCKTPVQSEIFQTCSNFLKILHYLHIICLMVLSEPPEVFFTCIYFHIYFTYIS